MATGGEVTKAEALAEYIRSSEPGDIVVNVDPAMGEDMTIVEVDGPSKPLIYALETGSQVQKATAQVVCRGQVVPVELEDDAGVVVYRAPSKITHLARIYSGGRCVKHVYMAEPVIRW